MPDPTARQIERAREIVGAMADDWSDAVACVAQALADERADACAEERERLEAIVRAEEEFPGQMPADVMALVLHDPAESMRAAVRSTKKSILAAIRANAAPETP